ncbi:MAG: A24 family peptidase [Phycisphaerales bacterium]|nr:A24 family peptidase [Phycisphaerales bacterium]
MLQFGFEEWMLAAIVPATLYASWNDFRFHRVPNWLNATIAMTGLATQMFCFGWPGLKTGLLGILAGFSLLILLWLMNAMGAGDVKFMAALGAWLGPQMTFYAVVVGGLFGGAMALAIVAYQRSWLRTFMNLNLVFTKLSSTKTAFSDFGSARKLNESSVALPYAIPLTIGTLFILVSNYSGWWEVL